MCDMDLMDLHQTVTLKGLGRQASVVTVWMIPEGRDFAHFVTAFPG
jgi:hypothetical protein